METSQPKSSNSRKNPLNTYAKYSAMVFQMAAIIFGFSYAGLKLDEYFKTKPVITASLALSGVFFAIYFAIKDFLKKNK
ncbi:MAG: AtpZ/AtpI family protein [Bacteroidia bacterium]